MKEKTRGLYHLNILQASAIAAISHESIYVALSRLYRSRFLCVHRDRK